MFETAGAQTMLILYIKPLYDDSRVLYTKAAAEYLARPYGERDAGLDLYVTGPNEIGKQAVLVGQGLIAALYDTDREVFRAYWMLPRSSISKTNLRLANSVGLIDAGYRGEIKAALYAAHPPQQVNTMNDGMNNIIYNNNARNLIDDYATYLEVQTRVVQLATPDLLPFDDIQIVDEIPGGATLRGAGGFGSTGVGARAGAGAS
jgi:dUTPase